MLRWLLRLAGSSRPRGPTCPRCGAPLDLSEELPEEERVIAFCGQCRAAITLRDELPPPPPGGYAWSPWGETLHRGVCSRVDSLTYVHRSTDLAEALAHCTRACRDCLGGILPPRRCYLFPPRATWVWVQGHGIAHRPTCPVLAHCTPKTLHWTDDPELLHRECSRGCPVCDTIIGGILLENPCDQPEIVVPKGG